MSKEDLYRPSEWGAEFHALPHDEALGAGAAGPGKSFVLLMDPLAQVLLEHERCADAKHPHYHPWGTSTGWALHLRRIRPMLEQTIKRALRIFPSIDPGVRWDTNKSTFTFSSGFTYQFGHCKDPNDWELYQGIEFSHIGFDELTQFEEEQYDQICTRLRSSDPLLRRMKRIRSMSNPLMRRNSGEEFTVKNPQWVRDRFVKPAPEGRVTIQRTVGQGMERSFIYLPAKLDDNPDKEFVEDYKKTLLGMKPHIRRALLYGDWFVVAGAFFENEWEERLHVCEPFPIPDDWPKWRSLDWGFRSPGAVHWYALDEDDTVFVFRELTFQGMTDEEVAEAILEIEDEYDLVGRDGKSRISGVADSQLWEQRGDSGRNKAEAMRALGVTWRVADKRSRQTNAGHIAKRLKDHANGTKPPGLVFFKTCVRAIQTIPSMPTSRTNSEEPEKGGEDHWYDSVSYGIAFVSRGRAAIPPLIEEKDEWDDEKKAEPKRAGKYGYGSSVA